MSALLCRLSQEDPPISNGGRVLLQIVLGPPYAPMYSYLLVGDRVELVSVTEIPDIVPRNFWDVTSSDPFSVPSVFLP